MRLPVPAMLVCQFYIEKYLAEKELNLTATLDAKATYSDADFVVIAAPTNVYLKLSVAA